MPTSTVSSLNGNSTTLFHAPPINSTSLNFAMLLLNSNYYRAYIYDYSVNSMAGFYLFSRHILME